MTEAEAVELLKEQFIGEQGFVTHLLQNGHPDYNVLGMVREALDTLHDAWKDRTLIPKEGALSMVDVLSPLYNAAAENPALASEIEDIADDLSMRIDRIFYHRVGPMSEEEALAVVKAQLSGMHSMILTLHQRGGLIKGAVNELQEALDVLQHSWLRRTEVPKSIAGSMLNVRHAIMSNAGWYPDQQAELKEIADDLCDRIKQCFS